MQYQSECLEALKSAAKISKPFEKVFMDTLKLFMAITGKVNFLQILSFSFLYTYNSCFSTLALAGRPLFLVIGLAFET